MYGTDKPLDRSMVSYDTKPYRSSPTPLSLVDATHYLSLDTHPRGRSPARTPSDGKKANKGVKAERKSGRAQSGGKSGSGANTDKNKKRAKRVQWADDGDGGDEEGTIDDGDHEEEDETEDGEEYHENAEDEDEHTERADDDKPDEEREEGALAVVAKMRAGTGRGRGGRKNASAPSVGGPPRTRRNARSPATPEEAGAQAPELAKSPIPSRSRSPRKPSAEDRDLLATANSSTWAVKTPRREKKPNKKYTGGI